MTRVAMLIVLALSSFAFAQERTLVVSGVLNAPPEKVYECFTTAEGLTMTWGVANAKVDFRQGGQIRTAYDLATDLDSPEAIVNTILAYEPGRMLAIKATAPANSPAWLRAICESGFTVIRLDPAGPGRTLLTCTGTGYKEGPLYDQAYAFFKEGNEWTIRRMQEAFGGAPEPDEGDRAMEVLGTLLGDWSGQTQTPEGGTLRARARMTRVIPPFIVGDSELDFGAGFRPHGHIVFAPDEAAGAPAFWNFGEDGTIARGHVRLAGEGRLVLDWNVHTLAGDLKSSHHAEWRIRGPDRFDFRLFPGAVDLGRTDAPLVELSYLREAARKSDGGP